MTTAKVEQISVRISSCQLVALSESLYRTKSEGQGHFPSLLAPSAPEATTQVWVLFNQAGQCPGTLRNKTQNKKPPLRRVGNLGKVRDFRDLPSLRFD